MTISMLSIDIAKNTFQLHGADSTGKAVMKKRLLEDGQHFPGGHDRALRGLPRVVPVFLATLLDRRLLWGDFVTLRSFRLAGSAVWLCAISSWSDNSKGCINPL